MDATILFREFLKAHHVHDYETQPKGPDNKVFIPAKIYIDFKVTDTKASLYRPTTKNGDPRIWFYGLRKVASPNNIMAVMYYDGALHLFNLTNIDIAKLMGSPVSSPLKELVLEITNSKTSVAMELLSKLRAIAARGPIPSEVEADTSVGRTLETALGIDVNSSKQPDYKGIELKSYRGNKTNRKSLFAQVPDWKLSKFKSSAQILQAFGYNRGSDFRLYCTVSATKTNSQGLSLRVDNDLKQLFENSDKPEIGDFVVWPLSSLHQRLQQKHRETFWVNAESIIKDEQEHFLYTFVNHTKKPINSQFDILLSQGIITVDHLIKRNSKNKVVEKGPLFKTTQTGIELLFPPSERYELL